MAILTYWEQKGIDIGLERGRSEGLLEGKGEVLLRQIRRKFGEISSRNIELIDALTSEQLDNLAEALLDFAAVTDLESWLSRSLQA